MQELNKKQSLDVTGGLMCTCDDYSGERDWKIYAVPDEDSCKTICCDIEKSTQYITSGNNGGPVKCKSNNARGSYVLGFADSIGLV